jgi:hypothetical protein
MVKEFFLQPFAMMDAPNKLNVIGNNENLVVMIF